MIKIKLMFSTNFRSNIVAKIRTDNRGFTTIELLLVIAVISILGALVYGNLSSVQKSAHNSSLNKNVDVWTSALLRYAIDNGEYPVVGSGPQVCLGTGYSSMGNMPSGSCHVSGGSVLAAEDSAIMDSLKPYVDASSPVGSKMLVHAGQNYTGAYYGYDSALTLDGISNPAYIVYVLEGDGQQCISKGQVSTGSWPNLSSSSMGYSSSDGSSTLCWILLPNSM